MIIDVDEDQLRARGVEYERHGGIKQAFASKEVIISAGTFGSPKILMLSGIGPYKILNNSQVTYNTKRFNFLLNIKITKSSCFCSKIPVHVELPVGKNFHDHLAIPLGPFFKTNETDPIVETSEIKAKFHEAWNSSLILRMPLINLKYHMYAKEMSHFLGMNETSLQEYMYASERKKTSIAQKDDESIFINVAIKKPISRGEVTIAGNNPKLPPLINPNYLNAIYHRDTFAYSSEKQKLIEALEDTVRLMEANPNIRARFTDVSFPGCESYIFRGYGYWDCYVRHFSMSFNHGVGTCAMGAVTTPPSAVVDAHLKVRGVQGLRVVDASVIPSLVSTYPFQSVAVVAEKGADMIIKQYQSSRKIETYSQLEINEQDYARQNNDQLFSGFRIKKLSAPVLTTLKPEPFTMSKSWQQADQIVMKSYSLTTESPLSEEDLTPPGELATDRPNPSYFPVRPLAGRLIFHPWIPEVQDSIPKFKEASRADIF